MCQMGSVGIGLEQIRGAGEGEIDVACFSGIDTNGCCARARPEPAMFLTFVRNVRAFIPGDWEVAEGEPCLRVMLGDDHDSGGRRASGGQRKIQFLPQP
jgi:hypothetical protein